MLNILLLAALLAGHPPRISAYPWQLMVGHEVDGATVWEEKERFREGRDCAEEAQHYRIAQCIQEPSYV